MKRENNESERFSEPTPVNARRDPIPNSAAFLRRQQAEARHALQVTLRNLKRDLLSAADPETWVQIAPWTTVGVAAASGFAAAAVAVPARHSSTAAAPIAPATNATDASTAAPLTSDKGWGAIGAAVSAGVYGVIRLALTEVISSALRMDPLRDSSEIADTDAEVFS